QGDVLATDNNTVGMGDAGIKSAIQGSNVPNPDEAVPSFVSGAMAKAGKGLLEGTLQAGTSAVSDKLLDLVRSEERFSRNAETDLVCRLVLEKTKLARSTTKICSPNEPLGENRRMADTGFLPTQRPMTPYISAKPLSSMVT